MADLFLSTLFGLVGGLIRAVVGIVKHYKINKKTKFKPIYFIITLIASAIIGALVSLSLSTNYFVNLMAGYAGIDLLENLLKIGKKKN